jgi:hypothetical protein
LSLSSPSIKDGTPFTKDCLTTDGSVLNIPADLICIACSKLPLNKQAQCLHKKPKGNPLKSSKMRKQASKSANFMSTIREEQGIVKKQKLGYYPKEHIDFLFSPKNFIKEYTTPTCYFACFDPNAGDLNHTACVTGYFANSQYVICGVDTKQTKEYTEFTDFFINNIRLLHHSFRKDRYIPIIAVIESQSSWNGDVIKDKINNLVMYENDKTFENIHILSDKSKQKHGIERGGVTINASRLNQMTYHLSSLMMVSGLRFHNDWVTACEMGKEVVIIEFENQLRRFLHYDEGQNSGYNSNGKKIKNNSGKEGKLNDDISDALHMFVSWYHWFMFNPEYQQQRSKLKL